MSSETIDYVCTMSPACRKVVALMGAINKIKIMVEGVVDDIAANDEVSASLKEFVPEFRSLRQVDIRPSPDDPNVMFKCFVFWDKRNIWHVLLEGGLEDYWENYGKKAPPVNVN